MDAIPEARVIQKEIQEYKREIILLEKELKKNTFEESYQAKLGTQEKLRQEMVSLNQELSQLKQEISKLKQSQEDVEKQEAQSLIHQIEQLKNENIHLIAQEEQLKRSDQLLDFNQQNYIYGVYQRRLGPSERENAEVSKKIKKCEEEIEKLKAKCEKVKSRYPSSYVEKLRMTQERLNESLEKEAEAKKKVVVLENQLIELREMPKKNPNEVIGQINEIIGFIEKDKLKVGVLEKKVKDKQQELRLAKLMIPKSNGSHTLHKEIELLSCILVDKIGELADVTKDIEDIEGKINNLTN